MIQRLNVVTPVGALQKLEARPLETVPSGLFSRRFIGSSPRCRVRCIGSERTERKRRFAKQIETKSTIGDYT